MNRLNNQNNSVTGVLNGINKASDIITSTMGGSGKNVLFFENSKIPNTKQLQFTKDGVSVAKKIQFKDVEEDAGAQMLITAANKTVKEHGDGTTLTSLFVKEFTNALFKLTEHTSINDVLDQWQEQLNIVIKELNTRAKQVESLDDIYKIALTSCKNERLAMLIYEIYRKVGFKANISVQLAEETNHSYYEVTKGLNFDGGMIHPQFANQLNGTFQAEKPYIMITDEIMNDFEGYLDYINELHENKIPLVIIARDFSDSFIRYSLTNKNTRNLSICLLKLPGWGFDIKENIRDIQAFLTTRKVNDLTIIGANKITVSESELTIYNNPLSQKIKKRVAQLESKLETITEEYDEKDINLRINNLNQSSAIIYVGGRTVEAAKEEFDRIEDAVGACKSAIKGGTVRGQGSELVDIADYSNLSFTDEFRNILYAPARKILKNANINLEATSNPFNVKTRKLDQSLIDPVNVITSALLNSFNLATLLINTSYILYD